jgi:hypothetical protein
VPNAPARPNSSNNQVAPVSGTPVVGAGGGGGGGGGGCGTGTGFGGGRTIGMGGSGGGGKRRTGGGGTPPSGSSGFRDFEAFVGDIGTATV